MHGLTRREHGCTEACYAQPECARCGRSKALRGRSVAPAAANGYCDFECPGYAVGEQPGHLWQSESLDEEWP